MSLNPTTEHNAQPFRGTQKVILEKRTPEGILDLSDPQPPLKIREVDERGRGILSRDFTFDDVYAFFFKECQDAPGSWEALRAWLDSKSWIVRAKTW
jgi:hypothetical protein